MPGDVISVSALNRYVKSVLESDAVLDGIGVRGEIQNFVQNQRSGHCYFSLKDETCSVRAVMFRSWADRLGFLPENGMRVILRGRVTLYDRDGAFQINAQQMIPDGVGEAQLALEQLKRRLEAEGLFDPAHKKTLPAFPKRVGLVTSRSGAALRDILAVARRRWPLADFLLCDASVQGQEAEETLVDGIRRLDESGLVDVIIVARGGGSREDLWVFNGERLARAAYACKTPLVSGVGHEIDVSILDFVADLRAATPTAAAEQVFPDQEKILQWLDKVSDSAEFAVSHKYELCYNKLNALLCSQAWQVPFKRTEKQTIRLEETKAQLNQAMQQLIRRKEKELKNMAGMLDSLSPLSTLRRGYCVASVAGAIVRKEEQLQKGGQVHLEFEQFCADCTVLNTHNKKEKACEEDRDSGAAAE